MLDWVVVGGGVHGTHLAVVLRTRAGVAARRIRVLDPHEEPLARWHARTAAVGMRFLRSTGVHHTDLDPYSMLRFARRMQGGADQHLAEPYNRPSVSLFAAHSEHTEKRWRLRNIRERGTLRSLRDAGDHMVLETDRGELATRRVLLAIGRDGCRAPTWARSLDQRTTGVRVEHVFHPDFRLEGEGDARSTVVVGGGMSGSQAAIALARRNDGAVTLLVRRETPVHQFDTDPGWVGPKRLRGFRRERCFKRRRRAIDDARHLGSVTPQVRRDLRRLVKAGSLRVVVSPQVRVADDSGPDVVLDTIAGELSVDRIVCATGFGRNRPGGPWLDRAIEALDLPLAPCGFPAIDNRLRWHPRIFVAGPLAELALGPAAGNIAGARQAGEHLVS